MHNGFIRVDDEKMSKSLGNFFTIRQVLEQYDAEVVRFFILRAQYRSPLNYSDHHLNDAKQALTRLYTALRGVEAEAVELDWQQAHAARFQQAMNDDFNTPEACAVLFELATEVNRSGSAQLAGLLKTLAGMLGLLQRDAEEFLQGKDDGGSEGLSAEDIRSLIDQRLAAKQAKNYAEADRLRALLTAQDIILEDTPAGTTWRRG